MSRGRKILSYEQTHRIDKNNQLKKMCSICNKWLECTEEYFYKNKNTSDGLFPYCKECTIKKSSNRVLKNKEKAKQVKKIWCQKNKEIINNRNITWRKENKEHKRKYQLQYQREHPEKLKEYTLTRANKNHKITKKEWKSCKEYFNNCCAYCGLHIEKHYITFKGNTRQGDFHKEHVIHSGSNDLSNCVPSCKSCNSQKWEFTLEDWYNENNPNFTQERLNKIYKWLNEDYILQIK